MAEQQLYINGGYTSATSGRTFITINPATGEVLATVQAAGREDVDRAVESAQRGQKIWAAMTAMERSRILRVAPSTFCASATMSWRGWRPWIPGNPSSKPPPSISSPALTCWNITPD
ncbi:aldehyde dehydrogenase family protein [Klebsiella pneumoniae]|nr:aldehyde dehydrogenase family protein [Klebsiella pneumoniae]